MNILGISAYYHDSAAALVSEDRIVAAAQEERFSRKKHDAEFPRGAVDYCLREAAITPADLDYVAFYEKPLAKFDRLLETYLAFAPSGFSSFRRAIPLWLKEKLHHRRRLLAQFPGLKPGRLVFTDHHESHAASAFFPSPFERAAILTLDGVGEWSTTTFGTGEGNRIQLQQHLKFPHSLGLLYSAFTYYCGFKVNSGEYKLMGLAPYGQPAYSELIRTRLIHLQDDGSFWLDQSFFNYCQGITMTSANFDALFGGPPRRPESMLEQRHMDLAASIQQVTEEILLRIARHLHAQTGMKHLVMAGGVALNCVANGRLLREGPFDDIWIQPAAGDAGGALGAALFVRHQLLNQPRPTAASSTSVDGSQSTVLRLLDTQNGSLLGPAFTDAEIGAFLASSRLPFDHHPSEEALLDAVARLLDAGKIVGWFHGRMEFGPRALGARSILGDARNPEMQARMNLKIKFRESFRPFAPVVLREAASSVFDIKPEHESPYMLVVAPVLHGLRRPLTSDEARRVRSHPDLRERVKVPRSSYPAITHVDYSARVQTVDATRNPRFHRLLTQFQALTGSPVLVNTSFNIRGEPIVCTPQEACRCFLATEMDALVLENHILLKTNIPASVTEPERRKYLASFELD